ncbi:hypothetical protein RRG08_015537 [Elysia crispata]|uniref:Uncharacterized protein n=1 Tax=Elysia crispata TaxID=231223 RepID=A0AAE0YJ20_9GAST|nr:hypothetical protein RRG08_015537 [Elysia crispata]
MPDWRLFYNEADFHITNTQQTQWTELLCFKKQALKTSLSKVELYLVTRGTDVTTVLISACCEACNSQQMSVTCYLTDPTCFLNSKTEQLQRERKHLTPGPRLHSGQLFLRCGQFRQFTDCPVSHTNKIVGWRLKNRMFQNSGLGDDFLLSIFAGVRRNLKSTNSTEIDPNYRSNLSVTAGKASTSEKLSGQQRSRWRLKFHGCKATPTLCVC